MGNVVALKDSMHRFKVNKIVGSLSYYSSSITNTGSKNAIEKLANREFSLLDSLREEINEIRKNPDVKELTDFEGIKEALAFMARFMKGNESAKAKEKEVLNNLLTLFKGTDYKKALDIMKSLEEYSKVLYLMAYHSTTGISGDNKRKNRFIRDSINARWELSFLLEDLEREKIYYNTMYVQSLKKGYRAPLGKRIYANVAIDNSKVEAFKEVLKRFDKIDTVSEKKGVEGIHTFEIICPGKSGIVHGQLTLPFNY